MDTITVVYYGFKYFITYFLQLMGKICYIVLKLTCKTVLILYILFKFLYVAQ